MTSERVPPLVGAGVIAALVLGGFLVLQPFLVPVAWAAILAYTTWPVYRRIRTWLRGSRVWASLLMTTLLILAVAGPVIWLSLTLAIEAGELYRAAKAVAAHPPEVPGWFRGLPWIGERVVGWRANLLSDPQWWQGRLTQNADWVTDRILGFVGDVGRNLVKIALTLLTVAFLYFHGETLNDQTRTVVHRLAGLWLLIQGALWKGMALLTWGALAVSGIDKVLRPLFIGGPLASRICWRFSASWEVWRPLGFWASFWDRRSCLFCWSCGHEWASEGPGLRNNG